VVHPAYNRGMPNRSKAVLRRPGTRAVRQSVSIPASLAAEVRRVAKERRLTISRALVTLAERGVRAEQEAKENLKSAYRRFLKEKEPSKKEEAGRDMIRAIFGKDSIAEDSIL
jgi:predicted DNA-binding ribbon-helix-helix protein